MRSPAMSAQRPLSGQKGDINQNKSRSLQLGHPVRAFSAIQRGQLIARRGGSGLGSSLTSSSRARANRNARFVSGRIASTRACKAASLLERPSTPAIGIDGARASPPPRKRTPSHPRRKRLRPRLTTAVACNRSDFSTQGAVENAAAFGRIVERRTQFLQVLAGEAARRSGMLALFIGDIVQRWQGQRALSLRHPPLGFLVLLAGLARRLRRTRLPDVLHEMHALLAPKPLNAADSIALAIAEMADSAQEIEVLRPVIAAATAARHRPDLMEAAFPEPPHVLRQLELLRHFADRPECARWLLDPRPAPLGHG